MLLRALAPSTSETFPPQVVTDKTAAHIKNSVFSNVTGSAWWHTGRGHLILAMRNKKNHHKSPEQQSETILFYPCPAVFQIPSQIYSRIIQKPPLVFDASISLPPIGGQFLKKVPFDRSTLSWHCTVTAGSLGCSCWGFKNSGNCLSCYSISFLALKKRRR